MTASLDHQIEATSPLRCPKCGAEGTGQYCAVCGASLGRPRDLSFKHFLQEAFVAVTDVDSALIASFRALLTRPGELTVEYLYGDRRRFMAPFRIFLLANLVYFVVVAHFGVSVLTVPLQVQTEAMGYRDVTRMIVAKRLDMETPAMTLQDAAARDSVKRVFAARYDGATEGVGKAIVVVLIPLFALVFQLLYAGQSRYYAEHVVLSTHLLAFFMIAIGAIGVAAWLVGGMAHRLAIGEAQFDEVIYSVILTAVFATYAFKAQRVVYETNAVGTLVRTLVLTMSILPMLVAFKFVLFLVTLYWIG